MRDQVNRDEHQVGSLPTEGIDKVEAASSHRAPKSASIGIFASSAAKPDILIGDRPNTTIGIDEPHPVSSGVFAPQGGNGIIERTPAFILGILRGTALRRMANHNNSGDSMTQQRNDEHQSSKHCFPLEYLDTLVPCEPTLHSMVAILVGSSYEHVVIQPFTST